MGVRKGFCSTLCTVPIILAACSGGGPAVTSTGTSPSPAGTECTGNCASASSFLSVADVQQIIGQGVAEAAARNVEATIAVVDRVGNVLAVYRMGNAASRSVIISSDASGNPQVHAGLEGIKLPQPGPLAGINIDQLAAIAKAITGAYLSSEGNAFSTRTASQIIQEHFNPGTTGQPAGPLFGVQFSQLACSDFLLRSAGAAPGAGPHPSPLGLSADPGGFPLYKNGTVVGGVGVIADGIYGLDKNIGDIEVGADEAIAFSAGYNYGAPVDRRADQITVNGVTLRFSDVVLSDLKSTPGTAAVLSAGNYVSVPGYADGNVHAGVAFGQPASGIRSDNNALFPGEDAYIFVDDANVPRFPVSAGTDGAGALTQAEVLEVLQSALGVANQARAQIRIPLGLTASVTISVVDTNGIPLGMVRTRDAPVFGADVSLQKARSAVFFSTNTAAPYLALLPDAQYLTTSAAGVSLTAVPLSQYVASARSFLGSASALSDGAIAYSDRAIGNLSRPFFPDGIDGAPNGPFSKPQGQWSVFSTGLQLDLSNNAILQNVLFAAGAGATDVAPGCAGVALTASLQATQTLPPAAIHRLANGLQIFPGSVPIYRGSSLVGGIGVSGDGVDQDDMVAFLGLQRASAALGGSIQQAPASMRADTLSPQGTRLLYVQCPQAPFIDSNQENVCGGF
jgi:uncharacterized protein GlcG (DUF336 family)